MRFAVKRTSSSDDDKSPCPGAWQERDAKGAPKGWFLEIEDLASLLRLAEEEGTLVVSKKPSIEIYDDYRE
ncbi:MAG TPA: hypothetical protein VJK02_21165 [Anaerolineales bacterium]|nr:hypothetical protein [Anaerolineales bacterium]